MATKAKKKIAVLHKNPNFAAALKAAFGGFFEGFEFITITDEKGAPSVSLKHVPLDCEKIATLNVYPFTPSRKIDNLVIGTKYVDDPSARSAQWDLLKNPDTDAITIAKMLQTPDEVTLIPESSVHSAQNSYLQASLAYHQEADNPEHADSDNPEASLLRAQLAHVQEQLEAVKSVSGITG